MQAGRDDCGSIPLDGELGVVFAPVMEAEALDILATHYGLSGRLTRFATEKDDTYRVDDEQGGRHVLKIANPVEDPLDLSLQTEILRHLERVAPTLPVPRIRLSREGLALITLTTSAGEVRRVRLMSFLDGLPLDRCQADAVGREQIGEVLGHLRLALEDFSHPAQDRFVAWDAQNTHRLRPLLEFVEAGHRRDQVARALDRFDRIVPVLATCRRQVLHNDFNTSNIVVDPTSPGFVTGIIDFGDCVRTPIVVDIATAMVNQLTVLGDDRTPDIFAPACDLLRGYLRITELTPEELSLIPQIVEGRTATRALLTSWRSQLFPENKAYILRNAAPGWAHLDWLLERTPEELSDLLRGFSQ